MRVRTLLLRFFALLQCGVLYSAPPANALGQADASGYSSTPSQPFTLTEGNVEPLTYRQLIVIHGLQSMRRSK